MNLPENWELSVDEVVYKQLKKIPKEYVKKITNTIQSLAADPYLGDIQKIKGEKDVWRRRAGAYRVFYELYTTRKVVRVFLVERRSSKTY